MALSERRTRIAAVAGAAVVAVVGGVAGAALYATTQGGTTTIVTVTSGATAPVSSTSTHSSIDTIPALGAQSVVEVVVTSTADQGPFGSETQQAQGSGFVYDTKGHLITNAHVVEGADSIKVLFADGSTYAATVVGTDSASDVAVVEVDAPASQLAPAGARRLVEGEGR